MLKPTSVLHRYLMQRAQLAPSSCLSPLFQSEAQCKAFHVNISFIQMQMLVHLHVNKNSSRLCTRTCFETEAKVNLKWPIAVLVLIISLFLELV